MNTSTNHYLPEAPLPEVQATYLRRVVEQLQTHLRDDTWDSYWDLLWAARMHQITMSWHEPAQKDVAVAESVYKQFCEIIRRVRGINRRRGKPTEDRDETMMLDDGEYGKYMAKGIMAEDTSVGCDHGISRGFSDLRQTSRLMMALGLVTRRRCKLNPTEMDRDVIHAFREIMSMAYNSYLQSDLGDALDQVAPISPKEA